MFPKILFSAALFLLYLNTYSQPYNPYEGIGGMNCQNPTIMYYETGSFIQTGKYKPERTDVFQNTNDMSVFRILIVFVEFANDSTYKDFPEWPAQHPPVYMNTLLAPDRHNNHLKDWWGEYDENSETLSDYYMEISRGHYHVTGNALHIVLPHDSSYYQKAGNKIAQLNTDLYNELTNRVNWPEFDNWDYAGNTYVYQKDHNIDMMYVVHRVWRDSIFEGLTGSIAQLYNSKQGQSHNLGNGYYIKAGTYSDGSGITFTTGQGAKVPNAPFTKNYFLTVQAHELGHYLFGGGHQNYGIMMGGWLSGLIATGLDSRLSPWETIYLGYGNPDLVNFENTPYNENYHLGDFSSRDANYNLQVLQVPNNPSDPKEFFLIALRNRVSSYDRVMWGDTAKNNCFREINTDYGKGVYIYHVGDGYTWNQNTAYRKIDQECADGLYDWEFGGLFNPDWSIDQKLVYFNKLKVSRLNDNSYGSLFAADEKSIMYNYNNFYYNCWGSIGKKHTCLGSGDCNESTDRIFTNNKEIWTSRAWEGDRWDAWNKGYNEIFSPYSSPSTQRWDGENSDVFIWIYKQDNNSVDFKIYKTGSGGYTLSQILAETPPSRPMNLQLTYTKCLDGISHPIITWEHNLEPDMIDSVNHPNVKRYRIERAYSIGNAVPHDYLQIADMYFNVTLNPVFTDQSVNLSCGDGKSIFMVRYRVIAVDKYESNSVTSDFVSTPANNLITGNSNSNLIIPNKYSLYQNYPNPFNPETNIKYDLPEDAFVILQVFDLLGREIKTLVNEYKKGGSYTASFNGSELASGIYFYKIKAGNFSQVNKMVMIK